MDMNDLPEWVARFLGGPYDGAEVAVMALAGFVGVKRVRINGKRKLSVRANPPTPIPDGYELYRLEDADDETATYVYAELDLDVGPPAATEQAGLRETVTASHPAHGGYPGVIYDREQVTA